MSTVPFDEIMESFSGVDRTVDNKTYTGISTEPRLVKDSRRVITEFKNSSGTEYRIVEVISPLGPFDYCRYVPYEKLVLETKTKDAMGKECWWLSEDIMEEECERLDLIAEIARRSR